MKDNTVLPEQGLSGWREKLQGGNEIREKYKVTVMSSEIIKTMSFITSLPKA